MTLNLLLGLIFSGILGTGGYYKKALSKTGVWGSILVGTAIFGFGGWRWGILLVAFFVSSSLLSKFKAAQKQAVAEKFDKGNQRDFGQTIANGGVGALLAVFSAFYANPWWFVAFVGVMATVNADTWGTELGVLSAGKPRLLTTGKPVAPGTSGGVSVGGTLFAFAGAVFIGAIAFLLTGMDDVATGFSWIVIGGSAGLIGSLVDSFLGATVQSIYYCDTCAKETEQKMHRSCQTPTRQIRGIYWLNNDLVNFFISVIGAFFALGVSQLLGFY